ncbi:MAG: sensor histidine kinase [Rhizobium sp.]|nr:sensor histidine kinase [Rhizobium sp.]MCZ8352575.1 sensor histidine kinase [Rhizobium sp.]
MKSYLPTRAQDFATLVIAVAWLGYVFMAVAWAVQSYRSTMQAAEDRVNSSSLVVATHAQWVNEFALQATRRIADAAEGEDRRYRDIAASVATAIEGLPGSVKVYIVDAEGNTRYSSDPEVKPVNITDRAYFEMLKKGAPSHVSSLLISRLNGEQIFVFSRRLEKNGVFSGTVNLSLSTEIMKPIWDAVNLGGDFAVSFIRNDGQLVARYPKPDKPLDLSNYILFTDYLQETSSGTYTADASPLDGVERIVGYRKVEGTPFVAIAAGDLDLLMGPFWRNVLILAVVTSLACLGSFAAAWRIRSLVHAQEQQSAALSDALKKNQFLLREIHHRVKNNLQSVMSLVRLHLKPHEGSQALTDRIKAMVEVHQLIYQHDRFVALKADSLIQAVVQGVVTSFGSPVQTVFNLEPTEVSNDRATALALLVNEVVSNSLKYAFADVSRPMLAITLRSSDEPGYFWLEITDNGPGFASDTVKKGTGTKLIEGSVRQLDGRYTMTQEQGAAFKAHLKLLD